MIELMLILGKVAGAITAIFVMLSFWMLVQHWHRRSMQECLATRLSSECAHCTKECSQREIS